MAIDMRGAFIIWNRRRLAEPQEIEYFGYMC